MHAGMILLCLWAATGQASASQPASAAADPQLYVVAVSEATYAQPSWRAVVDALVTKHHARVIRYAGTVGSAHAELAACMPDAICFVATPEEAGRDFVVAVNRMTRRLDDDPYTDALWGILTGYDAADALRIARRTEPLLVTRGASGLGPGYVGGLESGFAAEEKRFWIKNAGGKYEEKPVSPDAAESLAGAFNTMHPQVFYTSGHATQRDWQIGYTSRAGQFRHRDGQLLSINTQGRAFKIDSPEPKVYLPMGNCLIGHIDRRDCMATSWMHSGGVYQMYGYTAVTWFGRMGWGTSGAFGEGMPLNEAFYFTNQRLVRELVEKYPHLAAIEFDTYDDRKIGELAGRHKLVKRNDKTGRWELLKEPMGLLWDRDCVAFYGDPAWEARIPVERAWTLSWSRSGNTWTLTITPLKDDAGPASLAVMLPRRLTHATVSPAAVKAIVTDNFLLADSPQPPSGYKKDQPVTITVTGTPMVRPTAEKLKQAR